MPHHYSSHDLHWDGPRLRLRSGRVLASVEPDATWPGLWRVRVPDGSLTEMVNLTRAKDAAVSVALAALNAQTSTAPRRRTHDRSCARVATAANKTLKHKRPTANSAVQANKSKVTA